jgi:TetR/AcrR family transcriptional regulator, multidrug resistance operon repressor
MRERDEKKYALIRKKAIQMIVEKGFDGFSMQKLAASAKVSPATLYIYYKNRKDMLNQLYAHVQHTFASEALKGFSPGLSLGDGLWLQWTNRLNFILRYPFYFEFFEQFRNSPLIHHTDVTMNEFRHNMMEFVRNAMKRGEMKKMEPELFWSLAYGPFYSIVKFHLQKRSMMNDDFTINEARLRQLHNMVIKGLHK